MPGKLTGELIQSYRDRRPETHDERVDLAP